MKMYILIKDEVPDKMAPVIAAHASLATYKRFEQDEKMQRWIGSVFKKVVCRVSSGEFEKARQLDQHVVLTESALDHKEVCLGFCPREEYPKAFRFYKMWSPQQNGPSNE